MIVAAVLEVVLMAKRTFGRFSTQYWMHPFVLLLSLGEGRRGEEVVMAAIKNTSSHAKLDDRFNCCGA